MRTDRLSSPPNTLNTGSSSGAGPVPCDHPVGRGHHHPEDPGPVRPRRREPDRLEPGGIGSAAEWESTLRVELPPDDGLRIHVSPFSRLVAVLQCTGPPRRGGMLRERVSGTPAWSSAEYIECRKRRARLLRWPAYQVPTTPSLATSLVRARALCRIAPLSLDQGPHRPAGLAVSGRTATPLGAASGQERLQTGIAVPLERGLGLEIRPVAVDGDHGERPARLAEDDERVARREVAAHLDGVPLGACPM